MARSALVVVLLASCLVLPAVIAQGTSQGWPHARGWPEYGGTVARAGYAPVKGPDRVLEAAKPAALKGPSFTAPIADAAGNVYVGDDTGVVTKLSPTLQVLWQTPSLGGQVRSSLALGPDQTLFVAPVGPDLVALDAATGAVKWRYAVNNGAEDGYAVTAAPGVHPQGFVVQPSMDGNLYAVTFDGKKKWGPAGGASDKCVGAPAIAADGTIYAGCQDGILRAFKADGTVKWTLNVRSLVEPEEEQFVAAASVGADGSVYVTTRVRYGGGYVYAVTDGGAAGTIKWTRQLNDKVTAPAALDGKGGLYVGDLSGSFFRLDAATGAISWEFNMAGDDPGVYQEAESESPVTEALSFAEMAVVDAAGRVYVSVWHVDLTQGFPPQLSFTSPFYALNAADGSIVWREIFPKTTRAPLLVPSDTRAADGTFEGVLYLAGDDGKVYARATVPPTAGAPSPTQVPSSASVAETTNASSTSGDGQGTGAATTGPAGTPGPDVVGSAAVAVAAAAALARRRRS